MTLWPTCFAACKRRPGPAFPSRPPSPLHPPLACIARAMRTLPRCLHSRRPAAAARISTATYGRTPDRNSSRPALAPFFVICFLPSHETPLVALSCARAACCLCTFCLNHCFCLQFCFAGAVPAVQRCHRCPSSIAQLSHRKRKSALCECHDKGCAVTMMMAVITRISVIMITIAMAANMNM